MKQTTIRLTVRIPEELDKLIRNEAVRHGTNINQIMIYLLNYYFASQKD